MGGEDRFEPHLGRMRAGGHGRAKRYIARLLAAANLARGAAQSPSAVGRWLGSRAPGAGVGRAIRHHGHRPIIGRRVTVKARIVRLGNQGLNGALAHLRYLQRDGTTREGERGAFYGRAEDHVDGKQFLARGVSDRHQFRLIVSAEDGADYEDLKPLTRRLMAQAEIDLGTKLDWVAVDHFDTEHPHTHVLLRGVTDRGHDLVIARDYLAFGLRARASELVELDLGPPSPMEQQARRARDIEAERLTDVDRALLATSGEDHVVTAHADTVAEQAFRTGRLRKLERLGLAYPLGAGRWSLKPDLKERLRELGERGDIIRTIQRDFSRSRMVKAATEQVIHGPAEFRGGPLVGRVIARGLADEHRDHEYLLVDGIDGRAHYVPVGRALAGPGEDLFGDAGRAAGAIVRIEARHAGAREVDHVVAAVAAANGGRYDVEAHLRHDPRASIAFVEAHVRRLEALRRATHVVERVPAWGWSIPADYVDRAAAYERGRAADRHVDVTVLATMPLAELTRADAATWLDRELIGGTALPMRECGFGREVLDALKRRRAWLQSEGFARVDANGPVYQRGLLATLTARELSRAAVQLSRELDLPYRPAEDGGRIEGLYRRRVDLVSGRFALLERGMDFTLVPWRPVLEKALGRAVAGELRGDRINWSLQRSRSPGGSV